MVALFPYSKGILLGLGSSCLRGFSGVYVGFLHALPVLLPSKTSFINEVFLKKRCDGLCKDKAGYKHIGKETDFNVIPAYMLELFYCVTAMKHAFTQHKALVRLCETSRKQLKLHRDQ